MSNPSLILPQSPAFGEDFVYAAQVYDGEVPVYDVLPLTFTRASNGSRINKDGLVQNMPYNLLQYSNTFTNATWAKVNTTITSGQSDPFGGLNASRYLNTAVGGFLLQSGVPIANVYSHDEIYTMLKDFNNVKIEQAHIFPYKIEQYKNYVYEKKDYFEHMPTELFACLEKNLGWHLCITCTK
jgi:hypothetical protein